MTKICFNALKVIAQLDAMGYGYGDTTFTKKYPVKVKDVEFVFYDSPRDVDPYREKEYYYFELIHNDNLYRGVLMHHCDNHKFTTKVTKIA